MDCKFQRSLQQMALLDSRVSALKQRYKRAIKVNSKGFRTSLKLRIASYQAVRNMMYEYASRKCDEIEELQDQLHTHLANEANCEIACWIPIHLANQVLFRTYKSSRNELIISVMSDILSFLFNKMGSNICDFPFSCWFHRLYLMRQWEIFYLTLDVTITIFKLVLENKITNWSGDYY